MPATCSRPAAHLAAGVDLEKLGAAVNPATLAEYKIPEPTVERAEIECEVLDLPWQPGKRS
jgi:S-adenosylmethionine hydrolase